jgi:hypothetical protein
VARGGTRSLDPCSVDDDDAPVHQLGVSQIGWNECPPSIRESTP